MAGHETRQVRPRFPQDKTKIAAGSPLAVQGIFLEILRERFNEHSGLMWIWRPDITLTDLVIETGYNEETESRNTVPALYINRLQSIPQKMVIGDRAGVRLRDHLEGFGALEELTLSVDCVAADEGASAILGDTVQFTLLASQDVIQREFGFYDMTHPALSQTVPFEKDKAKWVSKVTFVVQFWIRWAQVPIAPLLQQITQRIHLKGTPPETHFIDTVVNSMRRGEVFDARNLTEDEALPPSRISIVGPPGPPGPPGAPGLPGSITVVEAFLVDQPLTGAIDSVNTVYTTSPVMFLHTASFKEIFYINGQRQNEGAGNDYVISESVPLAGFDTITVAYAPKPGDVLTIDYYPDGP